MFEDDDKVYADNLSDISDRMSDDIDKESDSENEIVTMDYKSTGGQ